MTLDQLQRFLSGTYSPSEEQLHLLAKRMHVKEDAL